MVKRVDTPWYRFQEEIREHFESLGAYAKTNVTIKGVRGKHDIDVLVKTKFLGRDITWIIEAKKWKSNVPKEKVLALLSIVQDVGADRGFIISEKGFQQGAIDSSENSNITLVNFSDLKAETKDLIDTEVLKHYKERYDLLYARYYAHSKEARRDYDLKHDYSALAKFSGVTQLSYIRDVLLAIKKRKYPIDTDTGLQVNVGEKQIDDFQQACNWLNLNLNLLDKQLLAAEQKMLMRNDFHPQYERWSVAIKD